MIRVKKSRFAQFSLAAVLAVLMLAGCVQNPFGTSQSTTDLSQELGTVSGQVGSYDDIEMPLDMKLVGDRSMAIRTDSFRGGILDYSGRVEVNSLRDFIVSSMGSRKWKLVGEIQSKNILLAFTKPNKTCMVVLSEGVGGSFGNTNATLYVTYDVAAAGKLNPFGEPINQ